jgi:hypothetical protein
MEGMLNDLSIGADTSRAFSEFVRTHGEAKASLGKMEFSVQVIQAHYSETKRSVQCDTTYSNVTRHTILFLVPTSLSLPFPPSELTTSRC